MFVLIWAALSEEQMSIGYPFSLLNDEQMSNKVGVEHQPVIDFGEDVAILTHIVLHLGCN